ncbi:MAG: cation:proton antiporter, partial [Bifidobacteriaceae bacterium]|nr:cation:proton antiporter [Bifidobacteriaceae bacterium]
MTLELLVLAAVAAIAGATAVSRRIGVAAPLVLVLLGVAVGFLPVTPRFEIAPDLILMGVLPPLLYSAAVSMPAMDFRRDLNAISGLSIVLVVISAVGVGALLAALVPGIGLARGIAVGAILSPTDAVATSIVRRAGAPHRVVTVLEGESLFNDASALVALRTALAATAASVSAWGVVGEFAMSVGIAVVFGIAVGQVGLRVQGRAADPAVCTAVSFLIPFVAYLPVEHVGASGLVAVVAAGLVTGHGAPRFVEPRNRMAQEQNWRTVEFLLEGAVFLGMGLQVASLIEDVESDGGSLGATVGVAALAGAAVLVIRAAYLTPLLGLLSHSAKRQMER